MLSIYFTAGFPEHNDTVRIAKSLQSAGADLIEIGIPFSDPVADGPTIQESNKQALDNGMTLLELFKQLRELRNEVEVPVILMGYVNPVIQYGVSKFCEHCAEVGIDGLILPDLPLSVYEEEYKLLFDQYNLKNIFLITPQTSEERIKMIDNLTDGFIYMVSTAGTTGAKSGFGEMQRGYFERVANMELKNPRLVGFGVHDKATFEAANRYSSGAIIGSAFIKHLKKNGGEENGIKNFIKSIR